MKTIDEELQDLFDKADKIIIDEVIYLARRVLENNKHLHEFINCHGSFFFTTKDGDNTTDSSLIGYSDLANFVGKWDNQFKITGDPIRFSLRSGIKTSW